MALFQGALAALFKSAGKILNTAFGWATIMLFGKVPQSRQLFLSAIAFGSVAWIVVLLGIAFPAFATFLLAFVTLPSWVDHNWIRLAMLVAAVLIPPVVGALSLFMLDPADRPDGLGGKALAVLKGYPYTLGLAITLVMMTLLAPLMKARDLARRWTSRHMPVIVEAPDYLDVVGDVQQALARGGLHTERAQASWMIRVPTEVLTFFAGGAVNHLVADQLTNLKAPQVEVLLHPSDLVISGQELEAAHAQAIIVQELTFTKAYMTWDKEANLLEDRLRLVWCDAKRGPEGALDPALVARFHAIEDDLRTRKLPFEEWEVLYREKLQVERSLLQVVAGIVDEPEAPAEVPAEALGAARLPAREARPRFVYVPVATACVAAAAFVWRTLAGERNPPWRRAMHDLERSIHRRRRHMPRMLHTLRGHA